MKRKQAFQLEDSRKRSKSVVSTEARVVEGSEEEGATERLYQKVAICGYGYRLPGGLRNDEAVWNLLAQRDFVQEDIGARYGPNEVPWDGQASPHRVASPYEGLMTEEDAFSFDCALFGMNRNEAERMDPQIKLLLQATWEAMESAGYSQVALHNSRTGVFCGQQTSAASTWRSPFGGELID